MINIGRIGRPLVVLTALGGVGLAVNSQMGENQALREQGIKLQRTLDEKEIAAQRQFTAQQGEIAKLAGDLNRKGSEEEERNDLEGRLTQTEDENFELRQRLETAESTNGELASAVSNLTEAVASKEDKDSLVKVAKMVGPSAVMIESSSGKWSGTILKVGENFFILTVAHSYDDIGDFVLTEVEVKGPDYSFKMVPPPFGGNKVAYFFWQDNTDSCLIPLPDEVVKTLPPGVGRKFRDLVENPLKPGETVFTIDNAMGLGYSVTPNAIMHTEREVEVEEGKPKIKCIQIVRGLNGGASGSGVFDLNGDLVGVTCCTTLAPSPFSYAVHPQNLKMLLQTRCNLPVMSNAEKLAWGVPLKPPEVDPNDIPLIFAGVIPEPATEFDKLPDYDVTRNQAIANRLTLGRIFFLLGKAGEIIRPPAIPPLPTAPEALPRLPVPPAPEELPMPEVAPVPPIME